MYDKDTGEPIIFTNVILKGTTTGAATDVNGYYSISKVEPGPLHLGGDLPGLRHGPEVRDAVERDQIITEKLYHRKERHPDARSSR